MKTRSDESREEFQLGGSRKRRFGIAVERNFAPFVFVEEGGVVGLAIDRLNALARLCDVDLEYIPVEASVIKAMIDDGSVGAAFPLAVNPDRLALFDFSDIVLTTGGGLFVSASSDTPAGIHEFDDKTIATPGTGPLAAFIRANSPGTRLLLTNDYVEPLRTVASGEADAAALNLEAGNILVEQLFSGRITTATEYFLKLPLALGFAKSNTAKHPLLHQINNAIQSLSEAR